MGELATTDFKAQNAGQMLESTERRHHILELRRRGMTYRQIAQTLGSREQLQAAGLDWEPIHVTSGTCSTIVKRYLQKLELEEAETRDELRTLENERLDAMMRKWLPRQDDSDPVVRTRAAAVLLKIADRRAKLNGLDAPTRVNVNHSGAIMHELGVDPEELKRERESFLTAFGQELDEEIVDAEVVGVDSPEDA